MEKSLQLINLVAAFLSLLILLPNLLGYPLSINQQWIVFGLLMLTTGLPHGATDHLVYKKNTQDLPKNKFWVHFLGRYLLLMAIYAGLWIILPALSLLIFLLMSFFHFGQSEFFYIKAPEKNPFKILLYVSWGGLILLSILHFNFEESMNLIKEVVTFEAKIILFWETFSYLILSILSGITFSCLIYFYVKGSLKINDLLIETGLIGFFIFTFYHADLLLSFSIYFGLWHAVKAIYFELKTLNSNDTLGLKKFILEALPFTLISISGILLLVFVSKWMTDSFSPLMLFFITISILTLPHMTFMAILYQNKG